MLSRPQICFELGRRLVAGPFACPRAVLGAAAATAARMFLLAEELWSVLPVEAGVATRPLLGTPGALAG